MNRRSFLCAAAGAMGAVYAGNSNASQRPAISRLGLQLFTVPAMLEMGLDSGLRIISDCGYKEVELFGPYPFSVPSAHERWRSVLPMLKFTQSGYFGRTAQEFRALLDLNGLTSPSIHIDVETLQQRLDQVAEAAHILGHRHVGISSLPAELRRTPDGYRKAAELFNQLGQRMARHGLKFLYHNHGYGLQPWDGRAPLKDLIENIDPELVSLELDVFWTAAGGEEPAELLDAYPGRYKLIHLKDMKQRVRFSGDGGDASQWTQLFPYITNSGQGVLDIPRIVDAARRSGVEHFIVEFDQAEDAEGTLKANQQFLSQL